MKKLNYIILLIVFILSHNIANAQNELNGKVINAATNRPAVYANIYIEDLKLGATSDTLGNYSLKNIPEGTYMVEVHLLGFQVAAQTIKIKGVTTQDFTIMPSEVEEDEVVVTGNSMARDIEHTPQAITQIPNSYLMQNASTNVIDALSKVPGVSGISDGKSISKPVIRGLGYNRVVTINDGVRQEGQQWGDEFGIEIDPYSVDRVEIMKGPASLVYGSDAISGVINFLPEKTLSEGEIKGNILGQFQDNNGLYGGAAHLAGNINGITFSGRVDYNAAHSYKNAQDGYVLNTQFNNLNADGTIGIHKKWGFSQLHYSFFQMRTGIADGAKDSSGKFLKQALDTAGQPTENVATDQDLKTYNFFVIKQLVKHSKLVWDNSLALGEGRLIARFAWQQNSRQENNDITIANTSNIWYLLNTYNYNIQYVSPLKNDMDYSIGVNGMYQNSQNKGTLLLIPEYDLFDFGVFAIANKKLGKLNLSAGIRYDMRSFKGHDDYVDSNGNQLSSNDPAAIHQFTAYSHNYNGLSASLGATYNATESFYLKANVAKGFRAPNVAESGSNGIHDGTVVYEIGSPNLSPESSLEIDVTPGYKSKEVSAEVSVFYNSINNFIYARQLGDSVNNSNPGFPEAPVFLYSQTDAKLAGCEAVLDFHPSSLKWFDWYTAYSMVNASLLNVPDSVKYIPFVPPARLRSEFTFTAKNLGKTLHNPYLRIGVFYSFEQSQVYQTAKVYNASPDNIPNTPAYTLLNLGFGSDFYRNGKNMVSLYVAINNLTDLSYVDYMSRYKYNTNFVNGSNQTGVCNMGRNIYVKLFVPLDFSKRK